MLKAIDTFDQETRLKNLFRGYCALCPDTGARLVRTAGRPKAGNGYKYVMIVPNEGAFDGDHFAPVEWTDERRKFIRAWSDEEAIELANGKLEKITVQKQ